MKAFKLLVPVALALCLVSCKKVENGYTAGNLEGSYWTGKVITDTDDINSTYECNLHLNAEGEAELDFTYTWTTKAFRAEMAEMKGSWSLNKGKLVLNITEVKDGLADDLPWKLEAEFLDKATSENERMTLTLPDKPSIILTRFFKATLKM